MKRTVASQFPVILAKNWYLVKIFQICLFMLKIWQLTNPSQEVYKSTERKLLKMILISKAIYRWLWPNMKQLSNTSLISLKIWIHIYIYIYTSWVGQKDTSNDMELLDSQQLMVIFASIYIYIYVLNMFCLLSE